MSNSIKIRKGSINSTIKRQKVLLEAMKRQNENMVGDLIRVAKELYRLHPCNDLFNPDDAEALDPVFIKNIKEMSL